jgi:hypothetical protein
LTACGSGSADAQQSQKVLVPQSARLFNFGDLLNKIWLPFPVSIFRFSAKFNQVSENHKLCNFEHVEARTRVCVTLEVFLRLNIVCLASDIIPNSAAR